jgi:SHAQKYF class myb-like DNA-binding protein
MGDKVVSAAAAARGVWSDDEHERFLEALQLYPYGPWKAIAEFVGTRTVRQVQTHAQKYHEKAARRLRDLRQDRERLTTPDAGIDSEMKEICEVLQRNRVPLSPRSSELQQRSMDRLGQASACYWRDHAVGGAQDHAHGEPDAIAPSFEECIDFLIQALESNARTSESESDSA